MQRLKRPGRARLAHHNGAVVLADEDASAVVVVGHAGAGCWRSRSESVKYPERRTFTHLPRADLHETVW